MIYRFARFASLMMDLDLLRAENRYEQVGHLRNACLDAASDSEMEAVEEAIRRHRQ